MIAQEVNFYQDRFKEKIVPFSAKQMSLILLLVLCGLAYASYWYQSQLQLLNAENEQLIQQKIKTEQELTMVKARLESLLANNQYETQIKNVSRDISVRKHMINIVQGNQFGSGKGFSDRLDVLAQLTIKNVWLNEIQLSDDYMKISGSALREENVPEYFNRFRKQEVFKGRQFDVFEMDRSDEHSWKVDFVIASRVTGNE